MELRWRDVEATLSELLLITDEQRGAFRARIRHLKAVGIPNIPKVGSGTQITYTRDNVVELYMALLIMELGVPPKVAAGLVLNIRSWPYDNPIYGPKDKDFLVIVPTRTKFPISMFLKGEEQMMHYIQSTPDRVFGTLRITDCLRSVDAALMA